MTTPKTAEVKKVIPTEVSRQPFSKGYVTIEALEEYKKQIQTERKVANRLIDFLHEEIKKNKLTYKGKIVSPILWERSLAVFGHALLAYTVIASIVVGVLMLLGA